MTEIVSGRPLVSVVVVNWNTVELLSACLASVRASVRSDQFEIIVVDNGSSDGSAEWCARAYPEVQIIGNTRNVGFGVANNQGIAASRAELCLLLNSDAVVRPDAILRMVETMSQRPSMGVLGCRLLNADGTRQRSWMWFPSVARLVCQEAMLTGLLPAPSGMFVEPPERRSVGMCDWVYAAAVVVRKVALDQVGGFDSRMWMYGEEMELCYRLRLHGWEVGFDPRPCVTHLGEGSWGGDGVTPLYLRYRGLFFFYRLHRHRVVGVVARIVVGIGLVLRVVAWSVSAGAGIGRGSVRRSRWRRARLYAVVLWRLATRGGQEPGKVAGGSVG